MIFTFTLCNKNPAKLKARNIYHYVRNAFYLCIHRPAYKNKNKKKRYPAEGQAVLDLDARDFGNFLVHPLMAKADLPSGGFEFLREGTTLDVDGERATFAGVWCGQPVAMEMHQPERCENWLR